MGDCANDVCAESTTSLKYDAYGNVVRRREIAAGSGRSREARTKFKHDDAHWLQSLPRLTTIVSPAKPDVVLRAAMTCYDGDTSAACNHASIAARGLATLTRAWDGKQYRQIGRVKYDAWGNPVKVTDARKHAQTTRYDPVLHVHVLEACDALRHCTTQSQAWDQRADAARSTTDANGAVTAYSFDELGRTASVTNPTGAITSHDYQTDAITGTTDTTTTEGSGSRLWSRDMRDGLGRIYRTEHPGGDGSRTVATETSYSDGSQRPESIEPAQFLGEDIPRERYTYDAAGRIIAQTHPDDSGVAYDYTMLPSGRFQIRRTDELGHGTTTTTDGWGAVRSVEEPSAEAHRTAITRYRHDPLDQLTSITDAHGSKIRMDFNPLGRQWRERDPDRGTTRYRYDRAGNVTRVTDARGRSRTYRYDALNRRTRETDTSTGRSSTWRYDESGHGSGLGRLTSVHGRSAEGCSDAAARSVSYDVLGQVSSETRCVKGTVGTAISDHDALGRLRTLAYPNGEKVAYHYDRAGHLHDIPGYVDEITYDAADQPTTAGYANHTRAVWHYDPSRHWLTDQHLKHVGDPALFSVTDDIGPSGLIRSSRSSTNGVDESYTYDALDQLSTVSGTTNQRFDVDNVGNLVRASPGGAYRYPSKRECVDAGATRSCAGPHAVVAVGAATYRYDATGNLTDIARKADARKLSWDADGRLTSVTRTGHPRVTNLYTPDGERVQQATSNGATEYFGELAEWSSKSGWTNYIHAGGLLVARRHGRVRSWYTLDRRGTPRVLTDAAGRVVARANYRPYGTAERGTGEPGAIGFAGRRSIGDTRLIDMASRDYMPELGRMLSADSVIADPTDPRTLNRYAYAFDNPISFTDPSGHTPVDCTQQSCGNVGGFHGFVDLPSISLLGYVQTSYVQLTSLTPQTTAGIQTDSRQYDVAIQFVPVATPSARAFSSASGDNSPGNTASGTASPVGGAASAPGVFGIVARTVAHATLGSLSCDRDGGCQDTQPAVGGLPGYGNNWGVGQPSRDVAQALGGWFDWLADKVVSFGVVQDRQTLDFVMLMSGLESPVFLREGMPERGLPQRAAAIRDDYGIGGRRNVAIADWEIEGQEGTMTATSLSRPPKGTIDLPPNPRFDPAVGRTVRPDDSERKIFENIAARFDPLSRGVVWIYSERDFCAACRSVRSQFERAFPYINVRVVPSRWRP